MIEKKNRPTNLTIRPTADRVLGRLAGAILALITLLGGPAAHASPDLVPSGVDVSDISFDCSGLAFGVARATVANSGDTVVDAEFDVTFFEDRDGDRSFNADVDQVLALTRVASALPARDNVEIDATIDATLSFSGSLVYVSVDTADEVGESDEENNLRHSGQGCQFAPPTTFSLVQKWNWRSSSTLSSYVQVMMTPIVAGITDDNGDGRVDDRDIPDVVFSTFAGSRYASNSVVRAVRGDDGSEIFTTPLTADLDVLGEGSIAVADIDGDGLIEIIANEDISETHDTDRFGRLIVFEHDGTFKFKSDLMNDGRLRWGGAAVADLNVDGTPEIVVGRYVFSSTGRVLAVGTAARGDNGVGPLSTVADIDLDGIPEIVAGFTVYEVETDAKGAITGLQVGWQARDNAGSIVAGDGFPGIGNFDADLRAEVVVVSAGAVWLFDDDGSFLWRSAIPGGGRGGPPNVDDFDNDGRVEVGTAGVARYVVFDTDGAKLWDSPISESSSNVTGSSVFDFEGDGSAEVVYKDQTRLRVYRGSDGFVLSAVATGSGTTYENPVIADVDRDGNAEIIVSANDYAFGNKRGIQVFADLRDGWVNTRRIWNQHTYHITNVNDDGTVPEFATPNWLTFNSFRSQRGARRDEIFAAPDVTASRVTVEGSQVSARVGNAGAVVAPAPIDIAFYERDLVASTTRLLGITQTSVDLLPGESEDVSLVLDAPIGDGVSVCAVADDAGEGTGAINECRQDNNQCCTDTQPLSCRVVKFDPLCVADCNPLVVELREIDGVTLIPDAARFVPVASLVGLDVAWAAFAAVASSFHAVTVLPPTPET